MHKNHTACRTTAEDKGILSSLFNTLGFLISCPLHGDPVLFSMTHLNWTKAQSKSIHILSSMLIVGPGFCSAFWYLYSGTLLGTWPDDCRWVPIF